MRALRGVVFFSLLGTAVFLIFTYLPTFFGVSYEASSISEGTQAASTVQAVSVIHLETPEPLKAIYMTACVASTPSWRANLKSLIETTELNAVMIDIKDYTGEVSFREGARCFVKDIEDFINELHQSDIYVIGRISVFQDPAYTKLKPELAVKSKQTGEVWKDYKGLSFIDVGAKPYWDYIVELAKDSYELGFDEINFDYVRYPSDGNMLDADFTWSNASSTKAQMLESFFIYLDAELEDTEVVTSVDLFGMTTTLKTDMNIGQILERALPHFDYVAPMVYPSHYPKGWNGFANPAEKPYEVIKITMGRGLEREQAFNISNGLATSTPSKLRPWLQDFHLGATYDADKVRAQIQATYDVGLTSWMLWNAGNIYTKGALKSE